MATAEEAEPGSITLLITEAMGAHFRLPASPTDTVGHVEAALGVASGGRPANSVRLVFENTKLLEMSWGKNADGSNQSSGAFAWLGCGSAPPSGAR